MGNSQSVKPSVGSIISYEEALTRITGEEYEHLKISYDELLCLPDQSNFVSKAFLGFPEKFSGKITTLLFYVVFASCLDNLASDYNSTS